MFVFVDESGYSGLKIDAGSSRFFTVVLVVFADEEEVRACDVQLNSLRKELRKPPDFEFHFSENTNRVREAFLGAAAKLDFVYYAFVLDKDPRKLWGPGFKYKASLYKVVCRYVFENARDRLVDANVTFDRSGPWTFQAALGKYIKGLNDKGKKIIKSVKMMSSRSSNQLQLADYVAAVTNRVQQGKKKNADVYWRYIAHKQISVQKWPE
ncbi:DUF3800 domain-containing protein [Candidatus Uhrbacteria bacterium]|nr:DUF3800 domain-containing protein [Candidatus Uhrbacteria bacterium]